MVEALFNQLLAAAHRVSPPKLNGKLANPNIIEQWLLHDDRRLLPIQSEDSKSDNLVLHHHDPPVSKLLPLNPLGNRARFRRPRGFVVLEVARPRGFRCARLDK